MRRTPMLVALGFKTHIPVLHVTFPHISTPLRGVQTRVSDVAGFIKIPDRIGY